MDTACPRAIVEMPMKKAKTKNLVMIGLKCFILELSDLVVLNNSLVGEKRQFLL